MPSSKILMTDQAQLTNPASMERKVDGSLSFDSIFIQIGNAVREFFRNRPAEERKEELWCYTFTGITTSSSGRTGLIPAVFEEMDGGVSADGKRQIVVFDTVQGCSAVFAFYKKAMVEGRLHGCFGIVLVQPIPRRDSWLNGEGLRVAVLPEPQASQAEVLSNSYQYPDKDTELLDIPPQEDNQA